MIIHQLEQGSDTWKDFRKNGVGASDIPIILGLSEYQKVDKLFLQKIGESPENTENFAMRRGKELEPRVRDWFNQITQSSYKPLVVSHPVFKWAFASLDGYEHDDKHEDGSTICEIKFNGAEKHEIAKQGNVPPAHLAQMLWQMFCANVSKGFYISTSGKPDDVHVVNVDFEQETFNDIFKKAQWFYNCVMTRTPPTDPLSNDLIDLLEKYERFAIQNKMIEEQMKELKGIIQDITPQDKTITWGRISGQWITKKGNVDYDRLIETECFGVNKEIYREKPMTYFKLGLSK